MGSRCYAIGRILWCCYYQLLVSKGINQVMGSVAEKFIGDKVVWWSVCRCACVLLLSWSVASSGAEDESAVADPLEPINRVIFNFNNHADNYVLRPVAQSYDAVTPTVVRRGVNNFFANLWDINGALNAFLQGRFRYGVDNTLRFVTNSTLGFFGVFDIASDMGIRKYPTDFGHTMALWGAPEGAYVVVPLLGPRTIRSGLGTVFDAYASPTGQVGNAEEQWGLRAVELIDLRAGLLGTDRLLSGDQYIFFRDAYLQQRAALISDGQAKDSFSEFDDTWEEDDL